MKTYTVWYVRIDAVNHESADNIFVCGVPDENLALNIARGLVDDFDVVLSSWVEED